MTAPAGWAFCDWHGRQDALMAAGHEPVGETVDVAMTAAAVQARTGPAIFEHGTTAGLNTHKRYGTQICPPCKAAGVEYDRARNARIKAAALVSA